MAADSAAGLRTGDAPLDGIRVVEAGTYMSAPFAGMMLAQLGAEVTKVEPCSGDPFRRFSLKQHQTSAAWINVNHGKTCIPLDLKDPDHVEELHRLLDAADVFVHNWRPGVATSLGLDPAVLSARHPSLIHLSITGFGETGPRRSVPVFDGLLQAASGFAAREAGPGQKPVTTRSFIVDKTTASFATQSILAALFDRTRTGRGAQLELAMLDVMAYFNFPDLCQDRTFLPPAPHVDLPAGRSAILRTSDGYVLVAPVSGRQISNAVTAVGHAEWKDDLKQIASPVELLDELLNRLETVTRSWTTVESEQAFQDHDVPAIAVFDIDAHFADAQTVHNELYTDGDSPVGPIRRVRYPLRRDGSALPEVAAASLLGAPSSSQGSASLRTDKSRTDKSRTNNKDEP